MQCACAVFSSEAYPTIQCYSTLPHKWQDFRKKKWIVEHKTGFDFFLQLRMKLFSFLRITEWDMIKMCIVLHTKWPLLSDFNWNWFFSIGFRKTHKLQENSSIESRVFPWGRTDRWAVTNSSTANTHAYVLFLNSTTHQPSSSGKSSIDTSHIYWLNSAQD